MKSRQAWVQLGSAALCSAAILLSIGGGNVGAQEVQDAADQNATGQNATGQNATNQNATDTNLTNSNAVILPPVPTSISNPFYPELSGIVELYSDAEDAIPSIGHLRPRSVEGLTSDNDSVNWLTSVSLPLYVSPNGAHWGWIHKGYLVQGESALAIGRDAGFAMVKPYENLYTFPVLEIRDDGWFQVQYTTGGSAWAHTSHLAVGDIPLVIERWELLLSSQAALYFLERTEAQALRSQPQEATNMLSFIATDSLIEPISIVGDWMRVKVTSPTLLCEPLTGSTVTEGWMRWRGNNNESLVWYNPDGSCSQTS